MFCFSWLISYYCILHKHSTTWNSLNTLSSYQLKPNMKLTWNQIWNSGYRILISNSGCLRTILGLPWWLRWERICLQCRRSEFDSWVGETPWRREWQPTAVFLPGESHGQRSLADTVHGVAELDATENECFHFSTGGSLLVPSSVRCFRWLSVFAF